MPRPLSNFSQILSTLMENKGLKEQDVVKATGLPQTTISSILKGKSKHPRPITLKRLADLFNVSIEELLEFENRLNDLSSLSQRPNPSTIPVIEWNDIKQWLSKSDNTSIASRWLLNGVCKSPQSFALKAKPSMRSHFFSPNAIFLVDPNASLEDGRIILVFLDQSNEPALRLLTIDGGKKKLQSLEKDPSSMPLSSKHLVVGPVVEVRYDPTLK